ncbi:MAG TPA: phosphoenolpyruvate carboxykinase (ATP), partial [Flavobacterium sp.]
MDNNILFSQSISLKDLGIENAKINYQLSPDELHEITIKSGQGVESSTGALAINTGEYTGRSPLDRFIVKDNITENQVWWGKVNIPFESDAFEALYKKVTAYLSHREIFVRDSYVCADPNYRLNVRVITETAWANLFCYNMF